VIVIHEKRISVSAAASHAPTRDTAIENVRDSVKPTAAPAASPSDSRPAARLGTRRWKCRESGLWAFLRGWLTSDAGTHAEATEASNRGSVSAARQGRSGANSQSRLMVPADAYVRLCNILNSIANLCIRSCRSALLRQLPTAILTPPRNGPRQRDETEKMGACWRSGATF
jgi:hypothetical protein